MRVLPNLGPVVFSFCFAATLTACGGNDPEPAPESSGDGDGDGDTTVARVACEDDSECSDSNACNGEETCEDGFCAPGEEVDCNDRVDCTRDLCDPVDGTCFNTPPDNDGDGHTAANCVDRDGAPLGDDCDDSDSNRFPGNTEVCGETDQAHDEDCDPRTFGQRDLDGDGYHDQVCRNKDDDGTVYRGEDCNDAVRTINPDNSEVCDGFDNNCDGEVDEGLTIKGFRDSDGDGIGVPVTTGDLLPGDVVDGKGRLEVCPGTAAVVDEDVDCDDGNPLVHKNMFELCDGVDNDCDGLVDNNIVLATWYRDADGDGFGSPGGPVQVSCEVLVGFSLYPTDCDDSNPLSNPNQPEICDGRDNDCDGSADFLVSPGNFEDDDGDGSPDPACGTAAPDCDDENVNVRPGAPELCDGIDNDCNGVADTLTQAVLWYVDEDGDGWGNPLVPPVDTCDAVEGRVTQVGDCDDRDPLRNPGQADDCNGLPGYDDDCDGILDEDEEAVAFYIDSDGDGYGELGSEPLYRCQQPAGWASVSSDCNDTDDDISPLNAEVCTPGDDMDDDCDGFVDCADADCSSDPDCLGLYEIALESPSTPVVAILATPFTATVSVENSLGDPQTSFDLDVSCEGGAVTTTPTVQTDGAGEASITLYPGLAQGMYRCTVEDALDFAIPLTINIQAVAPPNGSIHTVFNLAGTEGITITGPALTATLRIPQAVEVGADNVAYILDQADDQIYVVSPEGLVTTLLDAGQKSQLGSPYSMTMDEDNNVLYIGASGNGGAVYSYDLNNGGMVRILGGGTDAYLEGIAATSVDIGNPYGISFREGVGLAYADSTENAGIVRPDGTLYIWPKGTCADSNPYLNECDNDGCGVALTETGALLSLAWWCHPNNSSNGYRIARLDPQNTERQILSATSGGGGNVPLSQLLVGVPKALEFDHDGNLIVADDHRVRLIDRHDQFALDLAGGQAAGFAGDYGPGAAASLNDPIDVAVAPDGSIWVATTNDNRVRRIWRPDSSSTVESINLAVTSAEPTATVGYNASTVTIEAVDQDSAAVSAIPINFEGNASAIESEGPFVTSAGGVATASLTSSMAAGVYDFTAVAKDLHGVIAGSAPFQMTVTEPVDGTITSIVNVLKSSGSLQNSNWAPSQSSGNMRAVAVRDDGTVYMSHDGRIFALDPDGSLRLFAGGGGQFPDGVSFLSALFNNVYSMTLDNAFDRLYITTSSYEVLALELDAGVVTLIEDGAAVSNTGAASPDGTEFVYSRNNGVFVADMTVYPPAVTQLISLSTNGTTNCSGNADRPHLSDSHGMAYGSDGLVYVMGSLCSGSGSTRYDALFTIDTANGFTTQPEIDGVTAHVATLTHDVIRNMAWGPDGWLYYANWSGDSVNRWNGGSPQIVAGSLPDGSSGDLGPATSAQLNGPRSVAVSLDGDVFIPDHFNRTVRKVWMPELP